jgi:hypothetical protein
MYNNGETDEVCIPCTHGKEVNSNLDGCDLCGPGKFSNESSEWRCMLCPKNTYGDEEGLKDCKHCPEGTYNDEEGGEDVSVCRVDKCFMYDEISCNEHYSIRCGLDSSHQCHTQNCSHFNVRFVMYYLCELCVFFFLFFN